MQNKLSEPNLYWVNAKFPPTIGRPVIVRYVNKSRRSRRTWLIAIHNGDCWIFPDCLQKRRQKHVVEWAAIPEE